MASDKKVDRLGTVPGPPEPVVLRSHILGMDNRRAQNHILDSIIQQPGKDAPNDSRLSGDTDDGGDIVEVDLQIRKKLEYVCEMMVKGVKVDNAASETRNASLASETVSNTVMDVAGQSEKETWEPPSPAKSNQAEKTGPPGHKNRDIGVKDWLNDRLSPSEDASEESSADLDSELPDSCGKPRNNFLHTFICAGLDARTLVLLWWRGVLGANPTYGEAYPALLTFDQLDSELFSTKLKPKEALALLYDLRSRFRGAMHSGIELELKQCRLCDEFKLWIGEKAKELDVLHEFPQWKTKSRCAHRVCTNCTVKHMLGAFDDVLWMAAGGVKFHCPVSGCSKYLGQFSKRAGTGSYSVLLPLKDRLFMDVCYEVLLKMKATIKQELPDLSPESRAMGEQTATILRQDGFMMTVAEAAKNPRLLQLEQAGNVISMSASSGSVYKIPVFAKLLKRESRTQRCVCCRHNMREVEIQNPPKWLKTMSRCVGQSPRSTTAWGLHLLSFPLDFNGGCGGHPYICVNCLRISIGSVDAPIRQVPIQISCPAWGCQYVLKHGEIRAVLAPHIRDMYDWTYTNPELVTTPGFVWCSEPGCARGQVCGEGSGPVSCQSCGGSLRSGPTPE